MNKENSDLIFDDIQREIAAGADRLPKLPDGPHFIAPDSAPPISGETMARINPEAVKEELVPLTEALLDPTVAAEIERLTNVGSEVLTSALGRIKQRAIESK